MKIEYALPQVPARSARTEVIAPARTLSKRAPRVACLLAVAHRIEHLVQSGQVRDYAEIARLGRVSRARVSQIVKLLALAPSIQEQILFLPPRISGEDPITERELRLVVHELRWDRQRELFQRLCSRDYPPSGALPSAPNPTSKPLGPRCRKDMARAR
jgi:hypothetical protein